MMLADRRWFSVTGEQWDEFVALLDAPLPSTKFQELKARRDPFADE
jgi:uncharacterized protein (DUF1778 family)